MIGDRSCAAVKSEVRVKSGQMYLLFICLQTNLYFSLSVSLSTTAFALGYNRLQLIGSGLNINLTLFGVYILIEKMYK